MSKRTRDWIVVASVLVFFSLMLYGVQAWYFPAQWLLLSLAVVLVAASLYFSVRLIPFAARPSLFTPFQFLLGLLIISFALWITIGLGVPAAIMSFMGPNERLSVTVVEKNHGYRSCSRRLRFAELSASLKQEVCVNAALYDQIQEGERVSLHVRRNFLGTRVFNIDPS